LGSCFKKIPNFIIYIATPGVPGVVLKLEELREISLKFKMAFGGAVW